MTTTSETSTFISTVETQTSTLATIIPTTIEGTTNSASTLFLTEDASTAAITSISTTETQTSQITTLMSTTARPTTVTSTLNPTTNEETTIAVSTVFFTTEGPATTTSTLTIATPKTAASTVIPTTNEETTSAVSKFLSTLGTQTLPFTKLIPTTIQTTTHVASTVVLTTEKTSTVATTSISRTETQTSLVTTVIPSTKEETTIAVSTVFLMTGGPSTAASTLTTARPTTPAHISIPRTKEETNTPVSTVILTTAKEKNTAASTLIPTTARPTTAVSTYIPTTIKESTYVPTTVKETVIFPSTFATSGKVSTTVVIPTSTTISTFAITEITTALFTTTKAITKATTAKATTKPSTAANTTTVTTSVLTTPTSKNIPITTTTSATLTKTTNLTNDTTKTTATTTTIEPTTTTTTKPTTTTSTMATTTTIMDTTTTTKATMTTTTTMATTTTTTTKATTAAKTTTTVAPVSNKTAINIAVSVTFDMEFKEELNNKSSAEYKSLENKISLELNKQYSTINGFVGVDVTGFRKGSVIADFVILTAERSASQIDQANKNLKDTLKSIAPVLKSTAVYKSSSNITYTKYTPPFLTGTTMELQCGPPEGDLLAIVGNIESAEWKVNGANILSGTRQNVTVVSDTSKLIVKNLISKDAGLYECILKGTNSEFYQTVQISDIKAAPLLEMTPELSVECKTNTKVPLKCCVQSPYNASLVDPPSTVIIVEATTSDGKYCVKYNYTIPSCDSTSKQNFQCKVNGYDGYEKTTLLKFFTGAPTCNDETYGAGQEGSSSTIMCPGGTKTAQCKAGSWKVITDNCILPVIKDLLTESTGLVKGNVLTFSNDLKKAVNDSKTEIAKSSKSVSTIVDIVKNIANVSTFVTTEIITNVLQTIDVLTDDSVKESWETLNKDRNDNAASRLLGSLETLSEALSEMADVSTPRIRLIRTNATEFKPSNSTVSIDIQDRDVFFNNGTFMTIIILSTFNNVMPARNSSFDMTHLNGTGNETLSANNANLTINAAVVLVRVNQIVPSVNFKFIPLNKNLTKETQCVFWNFTLLDNFGAWDDEGCQFVIRNNDTVTCNCSHLTSFSVLMSTDISLFVKDPIASDGNASSSGGSGGGQQPTTTPEAVILDIITYIGVGISLASLVICLIIEGYVWKAVTKNGTALMRHISIVNTALSLLIADICFIIAASYSQKALENTNGDFKGLLGQCTAVTFFMHFFYLALFFWMLVSGLLLFYRTVMVFSHMSKSIMIAIGFVVGYGCPLIIAVTTVAATAPSQTYIRKNYICWLNWTESKALLSLVIPALVIVVINIIVVIVVLCKMMRRSSGNTIQPDEKNSFVVIIRCLAILTPLFGLTWALGIGTMVSPKEIGIHIAFAFFNSLQGFFILVFGTLFDSKIRAHLSSRMSSTNSNSTGSTSEGTSSFGGLVGRLRGRNVYHVSQARNSGNTNSSSESYSMI